MKKFLSAILSLFLLLTMFPVTANATARDPEISPCVDVAQHPCMWCGSSQTTYSHTDIVYIEGEPNYENWYRCLLCDKLTLYMNH